MVICGKYINLNKITKISHISLKFKRLLIFVILYILQCKIEGHAVSKSDLIWKDQKDVLCAKIKRNSIVYENALNSEGSLIHYKRRPSNYHRRRKRGGGGQAPQ